MTPTITIVLNLDSAILVLDALNIHCRVLGDPLATHDTKTRGRQHCCRQVVQVLRDALGQAKISLLTEPPPSAPTPPAFQEMADQGNWLQLMADRLGCPCLLIQPEQKPISGYQERMPYAVVAEEASPEERARVLLEVRPQRS